MTLKNPLAYTVPSGPSITRNTKKKKKKFKIIADKSEIMKKRGKITGMNGGKRGGRSKRREGGAGRWIGEKKLKLPLHSEVEPCLLSHFLFS